MASIRELIRAKGPSEWEVKIRLTGMDEVKQICPTEAAAREFAAKTEPKMKEERTKDLASLRKTQRQQPSIAAYNRLDLKATVMEYVARYDPPELRGRVDERPEWDKCTQRNAKISPAALTRLGTVTIGGADKFWTRRHVAALRAAKTRRGPPLAYATILNHLVLFRAACVWKANQLEIANPDLAFTTESFPENWAVHRERRLEPGEHEALLAAMRPTTPTARARQTRLLYRFCLETGARLQEMVLATWGEFNYSGIWHMPAPHTKKKWARIVPLSPRARRILCALRAMKNPASPRVFHWFPNPSTFGVHFSKLVRKAGIIGLRLHDCRHEAISRLCTKFPQTEKIMEIVGHRSYNTLLRYRHFKAKDVVGLFG